MENFYISRFRSRITMAATTTHLKKIGKITQNVHSEISKYFISLSSAHQEKIKTDIANDESGICPQCQYCSGPLLPDNCKIRIYPRPSVSKKKMMLCRRERDRPWRLTAKDKKTVAQFKSQSNKIIYLCLNCKNSMKYSGGKLQKFPVSSTPATKMFFNSNIKKKRKKCNTSINSVNEMSLNVGGSMPKNIQDTPGSTHFSSFDNLLGVNKSSKGNTSSYNNLASPILKTNASNIPKAKKRKSLLNQLLEENQKKKNNTRDNLSAFLLSIQ